MMGGGTEVEGESNDLFQSCLKSIEAWHLDASDIGLGSMGTPLENPSSLNPSSID